MKSLLIFTLYNIVLTAFVHSGYIYDDLSKFCTNNGMVLLSLTTTDDQPMLQNEALNAFVTFEKHGIRARRLSYKQLLPDLNPFSEDTFILLTGTKILSTTKKSLFFI